MIITNQTGDNRIFQYSRHTPGSRALPIRHARAKI